MAPKKDELVRKICSKSFHLSTIISSVINLNFGLLLSRRSYVS